MSPIEELCHMFDRAVVHPVQHSLHPRFAPPIDLPLDYATFISSFGGGWFGRPPNFAELDVANLIHTPNAEWLNADVLFEVLHDQPNKDSDRGILHGYPDSPSVLPWGGNCQGDTYYWLVSGSPDEWPVVTGRLDLTVHNTSMSEFVLSRIREISSLPHIGSLSFFPDKAHTA